MRAPEFSVIVPMFNSENSIEHCLLSLQQQTYPSFEAIVIDNGSTDGCADIVRKIAKSDLRFHYTFFDEVKGPSGARNRGLVLAHGNLITFVDSDDWVTENYLEKLFCAFSDSATDAVFLGYTKVTETGVIIGTKVPVIQANSYLEQLVQLYEQDMFGYTWVKAFRREVVGPHRFREDVDLLEDEIFACEVMQDCSSIACVSEPIYNYVCGTGNSLTDRVHTDYCQKNQIAFNAWQALLSGTPEERMLSLIAEKRLTACQYYGFERDVKPTDYFSALLKCNFYKYCCQKTPFLSALRSKNLTRLQCLRQVYRSKIKISQWIQKRNT